MRDVKFSGKSAMSREDSKSGVLRAVRKHCVEDCCCESVIEAKFCSAVDCDLWPYRFGHTPASVRRRTEGAELLKKDNFKDGAKFGPGREVRECYDPS